MEGKAMWIVIVNGLVDPFDFTYYGPFETVEEANAYSETFDEEPSWVIQIIKPIE
jgi:hypothetical protein